MPNHVVKAGEHLSRIARDHGYRGIATIWDHPANKAIRAERVNPHILNPGDVFTIPEIEPKTESAPTDQRHKFQVVTENLQLGLKLIGPSGILANVSADVIVNVDGEALVSDGDGKLFRPLSPLDRQGRLVVHLTAPHVTIDFDLDVTLLIGELRPVTMHEGQFDRLLNLGYLLTEDDADDPEAFKSAVEEFQCDHALQIDGKCGPKTQAKLVNIHGC